MSSQQSVSAATGRASLTRLLARAAVRAVVAFLVLGGEPGRPPQSRPAAERRDCPRATGVYAPVTLQADVSSLSAQEREMHRALHRRRADHGWTLLAPGLRRPGYVALLHHGPSARRFAEINYGPWDRLNGDEPFIAGAGPKPPGANLYPRDMSKEEFEECDSRRQGRSVLLSCVDAAGDSRSSRTTTSSRPSSAARREAPRAGRRARRATRASRTTSNGAREGARHGRLPAERHAWMDMKDNALDLVIGPIETYEDKLYGYRASYEGYVLVKDPSGARGSRASLRSCRSLQNGLPVPDTYKAECRRHRSDLNAYDVVYYAGDCNAGRRPSPSTCRMTRRCSCEGDTTAAARERDAGEIRPASSCRSRSELIAPDQRKHITFDAFFADTMFHEVAHGLGIKNTVTATAPCARR